MVLLRDVVILWLSISCRAADNDQIQYYQNLITTAQQQAQTFQQPTRNIEFEQGYQSDQILDYGTFDFIIVGAGSSGSVLATRLSEVSTQRVLLLEAGGEENDITDIPAMLFVSQFTDRNWGYYTKPQTTCCLGMRNNSCSIARGKVLGGCSTINALMYVRGNKHDFDKWQALGNPGWSYKHVLPYFKKSENSEIQGDPGYHGEGGLWNVDYHIPLSGTYQNFEEANDELNRTYLDYNGRKQLGFSKTQINTKNGKRQSTGRAFLQVARNRTNLNVTIKALVTKIVIQNKTAQGVIFVKNNQKYIARANNEVIISAGAINSPQILMLSGIGPKKQLESFNIPVVQNLPAVGQNMYDHASFRWLTFRTNYTVQDNNLTNQIVEYLNGVGPLTNPGQNEALGFIHTKNYPPGVPSLEYYYLPANISSALTNRVFNFNDQLSNYVSNLTPMQDVGLTLMLLHPKSKGSVTLQSNNPIDFPVIDFNYFSDPNNEDIATFIKGIDFSMELFQQEGFKKINATFVSLPICNNFAEFSKAYWECVLRQTASTIYHPLGTTRMGPRKKSSVVNKDLKVHGLKKLRVVDAGVIPSTMSGHLNAVAVMIAEKISDQIKKEYNLQT